MKSSIYKLNLFFGELLKLYVRYFVCVYSLLLANIQIVLSVKSSPKEQAHRNEIQQFTEAIKRNPDDGSSIYLNRANVRAKIADYRGAISDFVKVAEFYKKQKSFAAYREINKRIDALRKIAK